MDAPTDDPTVGSGLCEGTAEARTDDEAVEAEARYGGPLLLGCAEQAANINAAAISSVTMVGLVLGISIKPHGV